MLKAPAGTPPWGVDLIRQIEAEFLNRALLPVKLPPYPKADMPNPATYNQCWIYVTDEAGGAMPAFSDGTNFRRCTDRAIVS